LPKKLLIKRFSSQLLFEKWDLIVVAVSSVGIELVKKYLKNLNKKTYLLVLTKGLKFDRKIKKIITMSEQLDLRNKKLNISVLKGPCLAKELARKIKSYTVIANKNIRIAKQIGKLVSAKYYKTEYSSDVRGIEFSSAIKNIYSMVIGSGEGSNTSSALFRKSFDEMEYLIQHFKGKKETVRGLAGLGDLYVSAVGGRNSKMGEYLGKGFSFKNAKNRFMTNDTVEGADLAHEIAPYILNKINKKKIPLMIALLNAITKNKKLNINY
jgi:glycerol-3-phosphate dehydrogenase (NAD(P)+)